MIGQIVENKTDGKNKFKRERVMLDILSVSIGYVTGGVVGLATVVTAFFTGSVVSWFREHVAKI